MLSAAQVDHFHQHGYALAPHFFDAAELAVLRAEVERFRRSGLLRNVATQGDRKTYTTDRENLQLCPIAPHSELFRALPFCPKVTRSVGQLVGDPVVKILDQLFLKPAGRGLPTNWHTDNAYFRIGDPLKGTALWIALDDATRANGTLQVIPDVFREQFRHVPDLDSDHHIRMDADESRAVHCELEAGGVVFFSFGTPHATGANATERDRTGIGIHFLNGEQITRPLGGVTRNVHVTGSAAATDEHALKYAGRWDVIVRGLQPAGGAAGARPASERSLDAR